MKNKITEWALTRQFGMLSESEKLQVLEEMTEGEYNTLSVVLLTAPQIDEAAAPSPQLRATLMARFKESLPPKQYWYSRQVPFWKAAATVALVLAASFFFRATPAMHDPIVETLVQSDTVFRDKVVWKERMVVRKVYVRLPSTQMSIAISAPDTVGKVAHPSTTVSGASIGAQPELLQFFTRVGER